MHNKYAIPPSVSMPVVQRSFAKISGAMEKFSTNGRVFGVRVENLPQFFGAAGRGDAGIWPFRWLPGVQEDETTAFLFKIPQCETNFYEPSIA